MRSELSEASLESTGRAQGGLFGGIGFDEEDEGNDESEPVQNAAEASQHFYKKLLPYYIYVPVDLVPLRSTNKCNTLCAGRPQSGVLVTYLSPEIHV